MKTRAELQLHFNVSDGRLVTPTANYPLTLFPQTSLQDPNLQKLVVFWNNENIKMPGEMAERLLRILVHCNDPHFDCKVFVHYLFGFSVIGYETNWEFRPMANIEPFQVMALGEINPTDVRHMAVYLGHDLYLSKLGMRGSLSINTFDFLQRAYPSSHAWALRPKDLTDRAKATDLRDVNYKSEFLRLVEVVERCLQTGGPSNTEFPIAFRTLEGVLKDYHERGILVDS